MAQSADEKQMEGDVYILTDVISQAVEDYQSLYN
jgi:hypothetical protein